MEKKLIDFNINDYVLVKVNDIGREAHVEHWRRYGINAQPIEEDADGWSRWQMWDLMHVFGEHIHLGGIPPFETGIRFEVRD